MSLSEAVNMEIEFTSFDKSLVAGEIHIDKINKKVYINTSEGRGAEEEAGL